MTSKNTNNKKSLNNTIGSIVIFISWIVLICIIISSLIFWTNTGSFIYIIGGIIGTLGTLFNIYLFSKEKSKDSSEKNYD